ncbi:hypothetical protein FACS189437_02000 [Bacteroidia bacterium]|nr:hypothetical protein FACS189437_02000 [Bacteroidia bacterium]
MNFQCHWDATVVSSTAIDVIVLLSIIVMFALYAIRHYRNEEKLRSKAYWLGAVIFVIVLVFPALFCPLNVSLQNESISIHRIKGDIVIPLDDIMEIRMVNGSDTKNGTRNFGSGGSFGYLGKFSSPKLGNYQMYATDASKMILVKNKKEEYIIFSCDKPEELIGMVKQSVGDYAKAFRVQTKNGKNYVFSCENRDLVINTIKKQIQ